MATKTFKIGLSNTDKQNMSQDIYERIEQLLFNEYDPTSTYNTNDYVIYDDDLYRAIAANITGAWDNTKWQSATLNDLVDLVNGAVASVDGKANTEDLLDGSLVPNQSVFAKELIPVSEESGETQEEPFILQGTGTDNNTNPVDTGSTAKQLEKQGNTIVYNEVADFTVDFGIKVVDGITIETNLTNKTIRYHGTATANANCGFISSANNKDNLIVGHKYLLKLNKTGNSGTSKCNVTGFGNSLLDVEDGVYTAIGTSQYGQTKIPNGETVDFTISYKIIDLTQWFNGDVPQDILDNPSHFSNYYNGDLSYNLGELINCNGRYLETTGRNLWDGTHDIRVIPTNTYYCYGSATLTYKDKEGNTISSETKEDETFTLPNNCYLLGVSGTDICISIYYTPEQGGEGYDQYYPYEQPKIYDTGTEVLLSAGSVEDIKRPDGTIIRNVGVVDLGTINVDIQDAGTNHERVRIYGSSINDIVSPASNVIGNIICSLYVKASGDQVYSHSKDKIIAISGVIGNNGYISIYDSSLIGKTTTEIKTSLSGVYAYYELADANKTTEEGTPFAENIEINDYGMMGWKDTNNNYVEVPQGCKIFYPAWYVGFIDSLGARANWSADNIPLNSELSAIDTKHDSLYAIMQENIGGVLRHQLVEQIITGGGTADFSNTDFIDLGEQTWTKLSSDNCFSCSALLTLAKYTAGYGKPSLLCSIYKTVAQNYASGFSGTTDMKITFNNETPIIYVKNSNYNDATTFKNAMKGILLAYEKA